MDMLKSRKERVGALDSIAHMKNKPFYFIKKHGSESTVFYMLNQKKLLKEKKKSNETKKS